jgi:hypothetical protein
MSLPSAAIDCGSKITSLDPNAAATCTGNTQYLGTPCNATCNAGYIGSSTFTCNALGVWTGSLTCQGKVIRVAGSFDIKKIGHTRDTNCFCSDPSALDCGPKPQNLDANAAATCVGNTKYNGDACNATCNAGYVGGSTSYRCGTKGNWTGSLACYRM